jgi:hypothetical protein
MDSIPLNIPAAVPFIALALSFVSIVLAGISLRLHMRNVAKSDPRVELGRIKVVADEYFVPGITFDVVNSGRVGTSIELAETRYRLLRRTCFSDVVSVSKIAHRAEWAKNGRRVEPASSLHLTASTPFVDVDQRNRISGSINRQPESRFRRLISAVVGRRVRLILTLGNGTIVRSRFSRQSAVVRVH